MAKVSRLPQEQLKSGAVSLHHLDRLGLDAGVLNKHHWTSFANLQHRDTTASFSTSLELLYKITDVVLVICAVVFIVSAVASIILWVCGLIMIELVKEMLSSEQ